MSTWLCLRRRGDFTGADCRGPVVTRTLSPTHGPATIPLLSDGTSWPRRSGHTRPVVARVAVSVPYYGVAVPYAEGAVAGRHRATGGRRLLRISWVGTSLYFVHRCRLVFLVTLVTLIIGACASPSVPPAPTAPPGLRSVETATALPALTWTPLPTSTPTRLPTSTPTRLPTSTPTPLPTSTPRPTTRSGNVIDGTIVKQESLTLGSLDGVLGGYMGAHTCPASQYPIDVYRIQFRTRDREGEEIVVQADLRFPKVESETEFPLFVYGSGTTGVANACATLNEFRDRRAWGNYRAHLSAYATQGYITAIANWQGFDDPDQTHPYFVA